MAELRDQAGVVARADLADVGQIGTGRQDVLLTGDADRLDLAGRGARGQTVEGLAELGQGRGAKGVRPRGVAAGVGGDVRMSRTGDWVITSPSVSAWMGEKSIFAYWSEIEVAIGGYFLFLPS